MGFVFRLEDYPKYLERVGQATTIDITRRTDPAKIQRVWSHLEAVYREYGAPWIVQIWTKNLTSVLHLGGNLLTRLRSDGSTLALQLTATGLGGTRWEPVNLTQPFAGVSEFLELAGSPAHIKWRFDPIIPTIHRLETFQRLAESAARIGLKQCVINFIAPPGRYKRVDARLKDALPGWSEGMPGYHEDWRAEVASKILTVAENHDLSVAICAESATLIERVPGLRKAACGDFNWFVTLSGKNPRTIVGKGSRKGCGCTPYFDVGYYGQWRACHRCLYCYAG